MTGTWIALLALTAPVAFDTRDLIEYRGDDSAGVLRRLTPGPATIDAAMPTVVFVHGFNPSPRRMRYTMGEQLAAVSYRALGPGVQVAAWEWNAATFAGPSTSANHDNAIDQGRRLAEELLRAGLRPERIQLVGQSLGSLVAAAAARTLCDRTGQRVQRLTLLDPPGRQHDALFRRVGCQRAAERVEHYWVGGPSGMGQRSGVRGVFELGLSGQRPIGGLVMPSTSDHLQLVGWYIESIEHPEWSWGYHGGQRLKAVP